MRTNRESFSGFVTSFFRQYLERIRGASPHTVRSYGDVLRLYFVFVAARRKKSLSALALPDLDVEGVVAFLDHLEVGRGNAVSTRNQRLAALRTFFRYVLRHDVAHAEPCRRVLSLPTKRPRSRPPSYLEPGHARALLASPDRSTEAGLRDHALLLFLYNTGARVSEALALLPADIDAGARLVRLRGKGGKERLCPLWADTEAALRHLVARFAQTGAGPLFRNARGQPLSRDGVAYLLRKYASLSASRCPPLARIRLSPHVLRHSCAVALLQAGVDLTVIRDYLGHASVSTTSRYVSTNLEQRRQALETFASVAGLPPSSRRPWRPTQRLLEFLKRL